MANIIVNGEVQAPSVKVKLSDHLTSQEILALIKKAQKKNNQTP